MSIGRRAGLRLATADRGQVTFEMSCLDDLLSEDHRARQVWGYVEGLDLSGLYGSIKSVSGGAGRRGIDPAVLMTLWLYATLEDVGSARQLARLCQRDHSYRWILGSLKVSHKTLSDFRVDAGAVLDELLSTCVAALIAGKVIEAESLAVDGMRLRANAGASSFRSKEKLAELDELARAKVAKLRQELESDPAASDRRRQERQERAATDRQRRIAEAREAQAEIEAQRAARDKEQRRKTPSARTKARASPTDPQARLMKMGDGGYRPAFNVQVTTDVASRMVVGVSVNNNASDRGQLEPAIARFEADYGKRPQQVLADSGYDAKADIEALSRPENEPVEVICPWPGSAKGNASAPRPKDSQAIKDWYDRMMSERGKQLYKQRISTELPHADMRNRGLSRVLVRGMAKVKAVVLWHVHAYNFLIVSRLLRPA